MTKLLIISRRINSIIEICNLRLVENNTNRDYSFVRNNYRNRRFVKATNLDTDQQYYFNSLNAVRKHLLINAGFVKVICEGYTKPATSKKDNQRYTFEECEEKRYASRLFQIIV